MEIKDKISIFIMPERAQYFSFTRQTLCIFGHFVHSFKKNQ